MYVLVHIGFRIFMRVGVYLIVACLHSLHPKLFIIEHSMKHLANLKNLQTVYCRLEIYRYHFHLPLELENHIYTSDNGHDASSTNLKYNLSGTYVHIALY